MNQSEFFKYYSEVDAVSLLVSLGIAKMIAEYDVSDIKEGEIRNINDRENIQCDIGIDKDRNAYCYHFGKWKKINDYV